VLVKVSWGPALWDTVRLMTIELVEDGNRLRKEVSKDVMCL